MVDIQAIAVVVALLSAWIAALGALRAKQSADRADAVLAQRKRDRIAVAALITPGQDLLQDVLKAKSPRDHYDDSHHRSVQNEWIAAVNDGLGNVDPSFLPEWNARIDDDEIEAAIRERLDRLLQILRRM